MGETPLHVATKHGDIKLVKLFLEKDADIHAKVSQNIDVQIIIINTNNITKIVSLRVRAEGYQKHMGDKYDLLIT